QLNVSFVQGRRQYHFQLGYSPGGIVIADPDTDGQGRVPGFNASTSNKGRPGEPPGPPGGGTDLKVEISRDGVIPHPLPPRSRTRSCSRPARPARTRRSLSSGRFRTESRPWPAVTR